MAKTIDTVVQIHDLSVPLRIHVERRANVRVSLGKDFVLLRIPTFASHQIDKHLQFAQNWLYKIFEAKPEAFAKYHLQKYESNYQFSVLEQYDYTVSVFEEERNNGLIELTSQTGLKVSIPKHLASFEKKKFTTSLISKLIAKRHKPYLVDRVMYWNTMHFKKNINKITLKYNTSNWGSCSVSANLNFSTRALLLPKDVLDYIIVHELSHLVEMNHSSKFWKVVSDIMPDYEAKEAWIKKNGSKLDF